MNHFHFLNHASAGVWKGFLLIFLNLNFKSIRLITEHNLTVLGCVRRTHPLVQVQVGKDSGSKYDFIKLKLSDLL